MALGLAVGLVLGMAFGLALVVISTVLALVPLLVVVAVAAFLPVPMPMSMSVLVPIPMLVPVPMPMSMLVPMLVPMPIFVAAVAFSVTAVVPVPFVLIIVIVIVIVIVVVIVVVVLILVVAAGWPIGAGAGRGSGWRSALVPPRVVGRTGWRRGLWRPADREADRLDGGCLQLRRSWLPGRGFVSRPGRGRGHAGDLARSGGRRWSRACFLRGREEHERSSPDERKRGRHGEQADHGDDYPCQATSHLFDSPSPSAPGCRRLNFSRG
jgi:hypothetical protein